MPPPRNFLDRIRWLETVNLTDAEADYLIRWIESRRRPAAASRSDVFPRSG